MYSWIRSKLSLATSCIIKLSKAKTSGKLTFLEFLLKWKPCWENLFRFIIRLFAGLYNSNLFKACVLCFFLDSKKIYTQETYSFQSDLLYIIHIGTSYFYLSVTQSWLHETSTLRESFHLGFLMARVQNTQTNLHRQQKVFFQHQTSRWKASLLQTSYDAFWSLMSL